MRQLDLSPSLKRPKDWFGGSYLKNSHAKRARPVTTQFAIHTVLRARQSLLRKPKSFALVNHIVREVCQKHGVKLYEFANAGNHLHLLIKLRRVRSWPPFIRELSGRIAQAVQIQIGFKRGQTTGPSFWAQAPFTRVVRGWRRVYRLAKDYVVLNRLESDGLIPRQARDFKKWLPVWSKDFVYLDTT